jgi:hypothetical protein
VENNSHASVNLNVSFPTCAPLVFSLFTGAERRLNSQRLSFQGLPQAVIAFHRIPMMGTIAAGRHYKNKTGVLRI